VAAGILREGTNRPEIAARDAPRPPRAATAAVQEMPSDLGSFMRFASTMEIIRTHVRLNLNQNVVGP